VPPALLDARYTISGILPALLAAIFGNKVVTCFIPLTLSAILGAMQHQQYQRLERSVRAAR
jgi:hypothetical protein